MRRYLLTPRTENGLLATRQCATGRRRVDRHLGVSFDYFFSTFGDLIDFVHKPQSPPTSTFPVPPSHASPSPFTTVRPAPEKRTPPSWTKCCASKECLG